jgi:hypothetical protein
MLGRFGSALHGAAETACDQRDFQDARQDGKRKRPCRDVYRAEPLAATLPQNRHRVTSVDPKLPRVEKPKASTMGLILLILILFLLFGGGGYYGYRSGYYGGAHYGGGLTLIVVIIVLFLIFGGHGGYYHY